jgi:hypothetical protein
MHRRHHRLRGGAMRANLILIATYLAAAVATLAALAAV